jgi:hypothetical protein
MEKRQIRMQDGRYLIFYTFPNELAPSGANAKQHQQGNIAERQPEAKTEAEEERSV